MTHFPSFLENKKAALTMKSKSGSLVVLNFDNIKQGKLHVKLVVGGDDYKLRLCRLTYHTSDEIGVGNVQLLCRLVKK